MNICKAVATFFKRKKAENEIWDLNASCNNLFEKIYSRCRLDFGRELVNLMDMKKDIISSMRHPDSYTPVQEMIAKKVLELIGAYFREAESVVWIKARGASDMDAQQFVEAARERMYEVYALASSLNSHFYLRAEDIGYNSNGDLLMEAEALCNVLKEDNKKKMVDHS